MSVTEPPAHTDVELAVILTEGRELTATIATALPVQAPVVPVTVKICVDDGDTVTDAPARFPGFQT